MSLTRPHATPSVATTRNFSRSRTDLSTVVGRDITPVYLTMNRFWVGLGNRRAVLARIGCAEVHACRIITHDRLPAAHVLVKRRDRAYIMSPLAQFVPNRLVDARLNLHIATGKGELRETRAVERR